LAGLSVSALRLAGLGPEGFKGATVTKKGK